MSDEEDEENPPLRLVPPGMKRDKTDPLVILDTLKDAILNRQYDKAEVAEVLRQILAQYEAKNRVFMIAAANAELPRIVRLLSFLSSCEEELFKSERIEGAGTKDLIKLYALSQSNLLSSLDNVKKVADMRLEILKAAGGADGLEGVFTSGSKDMSALADLPGLDAHSRDRVRKLVSGLVDSLEKDDSVEPLEGDDESPADDSGD